jgi:Uma2 family endonuclease
MATITVADHNFQTLADLLHELGDIAPERVRWQPVPGQATEQDVLAVHERDKRLCELFAGVLVEKDMGYYESRLAMVLAFMIEQFLDQHDLGIVTGEGGMLRLTAGLVRIPDVSFIRWERLPERQAPRAPIPALAPNLAVEVLSKSNQPREMHRKMEEYFAAGVTLLWYLDPVKRQAFVYTDPLTEPICVDEQGTLDGGDVLPGFTVSIREWFNRADRRA